jgi:nitroimidazol reductase NimA-like FMN-containing flavoprotein (pyridoxamine 5'-phosphate oxidase superfamily)
VSVEESERGSLTERTRVRRLPARGAYDKETIYGILDDALIGHVGFVVDDSPFVIPMVSARAGDKLLLHGSTASRLMRHLATEAEVCVTVTHLDGLIVARSVFDSSMNYRSVVILGRARPITDLDEKLEAMRVITEHLLPGRWAEARHPNAQELKATTIIEIPLDEGSAKVRTGPPQDDEGDSGAGSWAGEIPIRPVTLDPIPDPALDPEVPIPDSVKNFRVDRSQR